MIKTLAKVISLSFSLKMDKPISKEMHWLSPGGYELRFADSQDTVQFDFNYGEGTICSDDAAIVEFTVRDLDFYGYESTARLADCLLNSKIAEIIEFYVDTEGGKDVNIKPVQILNMEFEVLKDWRDWNTLTVVKADEAVLSAFKFE